MKTIDRLSDYNVTIALLSNYQAIFRDLRIYSTVVLLEVASRSPQANQVDIFNKNHC